MLKIYMYQKSVFYGSLEEASELKKSFFRSAYNKKIHSRCEWIFIVLYFQKNIFVLKMLQVFFVQPFTIVQIIFGLRKGPKNGYKGSQKQK